MDVNLWGFGLHYDGFVGCMNCWVGGVGKNYKKKGQATTDVILGSFRCSQQKIKINYYGFFWD